MQQVTHLLLVRLKFGTVVGRIVVSSLFTLLKKYLIKKNQSSFGVHDWKYHLDENNVSEKNTGQLRVNFTCIETIDDTNLYNLFSNFFKLNEKL